MEVLELQMDSLKCEEKIQVTLDNIKRMLMSRNIQLQMEAVSSILWSLKSCDFNRSANSAYMKKPLPEVLVDSDMTEFLCEAMATINCHLLDSIFECLEYLAKSKKFYKNSHAVVVIECLVRTIYFLMENDKSCHTLNRALFLLSGLLKGYIGIGCKALQACAFNVRQVLELIKNIANNKMNSMNDTTLYISMVLNGLLENEYLARQLDAKLMEWLVTTLTKCLTILSAHIHDCRKFDSKLQDAAKGSVLLICSIAPATLRLCSSLISTVNVETTFKNAAVFEKYIEDITRILLECIQNSCAPYVLEAYIEETNMDLFNVFLSSLNCIYHEPVKGLNTIHLSHYLGKLGYLTLLPIILTWSSQRSQDCNALRSLCISVLEDLLFSLSVSTLDVEYLWPGGLCVFREHLHKGLLLLPANYLSWLNLLCDQHTCESVQYALIILSFFSCLCASSINVTASYLPATVSYLNSAPSDSTFPIPIIKAVWFIFAASSLSYCGQVRKEKATCVLLHLLEYQANIKNVYVHHPVILYWVFSSSYISSSLQKTVVTLWLEVEEIDEKLVDLVSVNCSAKFCLIDLTQCSKLHIVTKALKVLYNIVLRQQEKGSDELLQLLWEVLPHLLARISSNNVKTQAENIGGLLQLTSVSIPQNINATTVIRTAYLLTRLLINERNASLNFYRAAVHQAFLLLLVSTELQDKRALVIYMSEPKFLDILYNAANTDHPTICSVALKFLSLLLHYQMKYQFLESDRCLKMEGRRILWLLGNSDVNILLPSLQLTSCLLESRLSSPVMKLSDSFSVELIRTLYIKIQCLCTKNFYNISSSSWKCLAGLLEFSAVHYVEHNLKLHLATQPWTNFIVCVTAQSTSLFQSHNFLHFVSRWLFCVESHSRESRNKLVRVCYKKERALCSNWLCETFTELANMTLRCKDLTVLLPATKKLVLQIMNVEAYIEETNMDLFNVFLSSLNCIYHEPVKGLNTIHLSHYLGKLGYLTLLPIILTWSSQRSQDCNALRSLCISVLEDLLFSLSVSTLDVEYLWPGGLCVFREHLHKGLLLLPANYLSWLNLLCDQHTCESVQYALIILSFFSCLCASSINVTASYLPATVSYLNSAPSDSTFPIPIIKAVWFIFAASSLSYCGQVRKEKATCVLLHLLEYQANIKNVYVHHPVILYWVFSSSYISSSLQKTVVTLWLEVEEIDEKLVDLVSVNCSAKFCLIDLTQCSKLHIVTKALKVLYNIVLRQQEKGSDELLQLLWEVLPHLLARISSNNVKTQAENIGGLLQLTSVSIPQNINATTVIRTAYLLTRLLINERNASLNFYRAAVHQAFLLLLVSTELQDKRALVIYMSEPKFLDILYNAANTDHPTICSVALKFLSLLLHYQMKYQFLESDRCLKMEGRRILWLLGNSDVNILLPSLQLTSCLLESRLSSPVMKLSDSFSVELIRTLYIKIQCLCTKNFYNISSSSWKCLAGLLEFSAVHYVEHNLKLHLATQPWTNFIVCVTAQSTSLFQSHNFLHFVSRWLFCVESHSRESRNKLVRVCYKKERALCSNWLCETFTELANMTLRCKDLTVLLPATKKLVLQIMNVILESEVGVCEETLKSLARHLENIQES